MTYLIEILILLARVAERTAKQTHSKTVEIRMSIFFYFCALQLDSVATTIVLQHIPGQQ